jgi:hypothetical protein
MRSKNVIIWILLFPLVIHFSCVIFFHFGDDFNPRHFEHGFKKEYATEVPGLDYSQLDPILTQPFKQLGRGRQMTALISADGNYVLKLFNPRVPKRGKWYLDWKHWKKTYSLKWIKQEWFQTDERLEKIFARHKIAFSLLRDETGLLFLHLTPSDKISHFVHVTDKRGKTHILNLNKTPFVLQKKAILAADYLNTLVQENKITEAKEAIARIEKLFARRIEVGITDPNQTMHNNYGFIDGRPIQIDVGRISFNSEPANDEQDRILNNFHTWLKQLYPSIL